jgi:hypothetical protein
MHAASVLLHGLLFLSVSATSEPAALGGDMPCRRRACSPFFALRAAGLHLEESERKKTGESRGVEKKPKKLCYACPLAGGGRA